MTRRWGFVPRWLSSLAVFEELRGRSLESGRRQGQVGGGSRRGKGASPRPSRARAVPSETRWTGPLKAPFLSFVPSQDSLAARSGSTTLVRLLSFPFVDRLALLCERLKSLQPIASRQDSLVAGLLKVECRLAVGGTISERNRQSSEIETYRSSCEPRSIAIFAHLMARGPARTINQEVFD